MSKPPITTHTIATIPLDNPPIGQDYVLLGPDPEAMKSARLRWISAAKAKGLRAIVHYHLGSKFARFTVMPPTFPNPPKYTPTGNRRGRPDSKTTTLLASLEVGQKTEISIGGLHPQTVRNTVSRTGKRLRRSFTTSLQQDGQTYLVTRVE